MKLKTAIFVVLSSFPIPAWAQGTFQNLDFESANVSSSPAEPPFHFVPIGSVLPDWTAYLGSEQQAQVGYNSATLSVANISLIGPNWTSSDAQRYEGIGIIDGNYSVVVQLGGIPTNAATGENASIAQNGTIPATAESLEFKAYALGPFSVSFAGNALDPIALSSGQGEDGQTYTLYGANISAWAGQTGELEFTADYNLGDPFIVLDDISFSDTPEPSSLILAGIGGLLFVLYRRLRPNRSSAP